MISFYHFSIIVGVVLLHALSFEEKQIYSEISFELSSDQMKMVVVIPASLAWELIGENQVETIPLFYEMPL